MQIFDILVVHAHILTINADFTEYRDGYVGVKGNRITAIGNSSDLIDYQAKRTIDAKGKILMPGLVNTHTHVPMTIFRGVADDIVLHDWLMKYIFPLEKQCVTEEFVLTGARLAMLEMLSTGTTCFNDMYYFSDKIGQAATEIGMRGIISEGLVDFQAPSFKDPDAGFKYNDFLIEKYKNHSLISVGVASHAPYTCAPELLERTEALAQKHNLTHHIHIAETEWEFNKFWDEHACSPVQYLDNLGIISNRTIAAHSIWLTDEDLHIFKNQNVGVAHNPECNMKISSGVARIPEMYQAGIKIGLGTDGPASNNDMDMFGEMRSMAFLHKFVSGNPTVIPARQALRIATMGGAEVLNKEKEIGSVEIGKRADFIIVNTDTFSGTPIFDPYSALVYSIGSHNVTDTFVNGVHVYQNRLFPFSDVEKIKADARTLAILVAQKLK